MDRHYVISEADKKNGILSECELPASPQWETVLDNKKIEIVYSVGGIYNSKISFSSKIYKTKQDFYIHIEKDDNDVWNIKYYYKHEQLNEFLITVKQLIKEVKIWK